jgi:hypothetical protein
MAPKGAVGRRAAVWRVAREKNKREAGKRFLTTQRRLGGSEGSGEDGDGGRNSRSAAVASIGAARDPVKKN